MGLIENIYQIEIWDPSKKETHTILPTTTDHTSDTRYMFFSLHQAIQFSMDTNWVSYNLIQFWH